MTAVDDLMPDEDRRNGALDAFLDHILQPADPLTDGELVVLRLYSHGMTTRMVAESLCLAVPSIKARTESAREKLRAKTTAQACCEALRQQLIP